jgi:hypothetical protein
MKYDCIKNDRFKSDRIKSGCLKSDRIKIDRIKKITDPMLITDSLTIPHTFPSQLLHTCGCIFCR